MVVVEFRYASQLDSCTDLRLPLAKYADLKTSWPPEPTGHKSWKASRGSSQNQLSRPPPGLGNQKQPSPSPWSGGGPRFAGRGWGSGSSTTGKGSLDYSCCLDLNNVLFFQVNHTELFSKWRYSMGAEVDQNRNTEPDFFLVHSFNMERRQCSGKLLVGAE